MTFSAAYQGEDPAALAGQSAVQTLSGVSERFMNAFEIQKSYVKAQDAVQQLMAAGGHWATTGQRLHQYIRSLAVGIGDIGAVRLVSLSTEVTKIYNTDTVLYNLLAPKRANNVTDFTHGWKEDDFSANSLDGMVFDPNGNPPQDNATSARRTNTLTGIGATVDVGLVSNEMIKKRGFMDELDRQVTDALVKIKRSTNRQLLLATENANGPKFSMGGLVTRTTLNVQTPGGAAASVATSDINTVISGILSGIGVHPLAMLGTVDAAKTLMALLQGQFPGTRIGDYTQFTKPEDRIATKYYSPMVGQIPFYLEMQMPANNLLICALEYLRMAGFTLGDTEGPWVIALAQTGLSEPRAIFDLVTLEDRNLKARGKVTNIL